MATIIGYFILLFVVSWLASRKSDANTALTGGREAPWYIVAIAMIGAPISGVTFVSVPGMVAAKSLLPVLGVPVESRALSGMDSLLSIVQMPKGIPVGTLAIGTAGAANAALLAASMLANQDPALRQALADFRARQTEQVLAQPDPRIELSGGNA